MAEIDAERQDQLARRLAVRPDIAASVYPFKGVKLTRADVEWLLANHDGGRGPVDWSDPAQRDRDGLDLRGAHLGAVDLSGLPLARMYGGLARNQWEWETITLDQREAAAAELEHADLRQAHLEGAHLGRAHLQRADLREADLEHADLRAARLEGAWLSRARLDGAVLTRAHLHGAYVREASLGQADLTEAHLEGASLRDADLVGSAPPAGGDGGDSGDSDAEPADIRGAYLDDSTNLKGTRFGDRRLDRYVPVADVRWGAVNLAMVDWSSFPMLGDEHWARHRTSPEDGRRVPGEFDTAVRANRQLAVALQAQGLTEVAAHFAYRAQVLRRDLLRLQLTRPGETAADRLRTLAAYLVSCALFALAGYGYRPARSLVAYVAVLTGFAAVYYAIGGVVHSPLSLVGAAVFSVTSFHGRGFFPGGVALDSPLTVLAALEAFAGLVIEVTLIATLTQRLFGR